MLSACKLPFQCAHGRTMMVPLVKLNPTKAKSAKEENLKLWNFGHPHPPSISQFKMETKTWYFEKIFTSSRVQNDFTESGQILSNN